jgi:hypothetical protein
MNSVNILLVGGFVTLLSGVYLLSPRIYDYNSTRQILKMTNIELFLLKEKEKEIS